MARGISKHTLATLVYYRLKINIIIMRKAGYISLGCVCVGVVSPLKLCRSCV